MTASSSSLYSLLLYHIIILYLQKALKDVDGNSFSEKLLNAGVPAGPVRNMEEAINHPQTNERQMVLHKDDYQGIASPIKFSRSKSVGVKNIPPQIGEHTNEILLEFCDCWLFQHKFDWFVQNRETNKKREYTGGAMLVDLS